MNFNLDYKNNISKLLELSLKNANYELEVLFNNNKTINITQFNNIYNRLTKLYGNCDKYPKSLDIILTDYKSNKIIVMGEENILNYYKTNKLNYESTSITEKKRVINNKKNIDNIILSDYDSKIKLREENTIDNSSKKIELFKKINELGKLFRFKQRFSFFTPDKFFRFDLTIVKCNDKFSNSLKEANIFKSNEVYEVELEFIGNKETIQKGKKSDKNIDVSEYYRKMIIYMSDVLQVLNNCSFILGDKEKNDIRNKYLKLIDPKFNIQNVSINPNYFIGPKVKSLEVINIKEFDKEIYELKNIISIRKGYSVTEKSDGERHLVFIDSEGKLYLINDRLDIINTKITCSKCKNCILDSEYVTKSRSGENINHILLFDAYFFNGQDIRNKELKIPQDHNSSNLGRLDYLNNILDYNQEELHFIIKIKSFKYGSTENYNTKIMELSENLWNSINNDQYYYNIDGLIYTPLCPITDMIDANNKSNKFYSNKTWPKLLKWKPSCDNTIDFLVKLLKNNDGKDKIENILIDNKIRKFKTLILYTGFNTKNNKIIDPLELILRYSKKSEDNNNYIKKEFCPLGNNEYIANVLVEEINGKDILTTEKKDGEIKDNMVVEMYYDINKDPNWRWLPRNIRYDKTEKLRQKNNTSFGNDYNTALNVWKTYYQPITPEMLFNKSIIEINQEDDYYITSNLSRSKSKSINLRNFHNQFVKNEVLISPSCKLFKDAFVLDLGCGQGGDLNKFEYGKISKYLGINKFLNDLIAPETGAIKRYQKLVEDIPNIYQAYFINGDIGKNIKNGEFLLDNKQFNFKEMHQILFNKKHNSSLKIKDNISGIFENGFDIINIQFVIHYLFKDNISLNNLIDNIDENLKVGGLLIGTCYDGQTVFNTLKDKSIGDSLLGYDDNNSLVWRIKKQYEQSSFPDNSDSLGYPIDVITESIGTENREYLVNFKFLTKLLEAKNIKLLTKEQCIEMNLQFGNEDTSSGLFEDLYYQNLNNKAKHYLKDYEKEISFLNRWFIFQKQPEKLGSMKIKVKRSPRTKKL